MNTWVSHAAFAHVSWMRYVMFGVGSFMGTMIAHILRGALSKKKAAPKPVEAAPIPAHLVCPFCNVQHFDTGVWEKRPHHKHQCANCGKQWRVEPYCYGADMPISKPTPFR